jgi:Protein of unknown function (DUF3501)
MRPVTRADIVDYQTYGDGRDEFRRTVMAAKDARRVHVGDYVTLLFENHLTVRYQIQEMMRVERIAREVDIQNEIDTYNELLGGDGELGCTMLIEIDDPEERQQKLTEWLGLPAHVLLELDDGTRVTPTVDDRQQDGTRLSSVQYVQYAVGDRLPVAVVIDFPGAEARTELSDAQRAALGDDLGS